MTYKDYLGDLIGGSLMIRESQLIVARLVQAILNKKAVSVIYTFLSSCSFPHR
jgi:hypothetical protein